MKNPGSWEGEEEKVSREYRRQNSLSISQLELYEELLL